MTNNYLEFDYNQIFENIYFKATNNIYYINIYFNNKTLIII